MFRVKICGITRAEDALVAHDAGADAIGLNFYPRGKRYITAKQAEKIVAKLPASLVKVGVFVDAEPETIRRICQSVPLDAIQLHGDESPDVLRGLRPLPAIKACSFSGGAQPIAEFLAACRQRQALPRMLLVDAPHRGQYGGTGTAVDWDALVAERPKLAGMPLVLAGGLKPDNVAAAIRLVRPWGVDVASGVESSPGKKSAELVRQFVRAALDAFAAV